MTLTESIKVRLPSWHWGRGNVSATDKQVFLSSRDLGSATVFLTSLAAKPSSVLTLKDLPLLDSGHQPTGVSKKDLEKGHPVVLI